MRASPGAPRTPHVDPTPHQTTSRRRRLPGLLAAGLVTALALALPSSASALPGASGTPRATAGLEQVSDFGDNPGALSMYRYVPEGLPQGSPVVVILHGCAQSAADYFDGAGWQSLADEHGFAVVAPQQEILNNASRCFNWFEPGDRSRGQGEAASIQHMVDHTLSDLGADSSRVHVTGLSGGGAMTASLLASYPDTYAGGGIVAGLPHGCADSMVTAFTCMNPGVTKSAKEWGDLVRAAHPDHQGARPVVSLWHGSADATVAPGNLTESVKQWTDVQGADQEADGTEQLPGETTREDYQDADGKVVVRSYQVAGMGHGTPVKPDEGCGTSGTYFPDRVCSSSLLLKDWGLAG
ncbi:PHB depolymerase family esterase [Streptomyces sp. NPDC005438]|uniref:extracellular catalytic domain type 1 short-chain-length polyhydroxyalkanoate depolymerase n=1 Tax=Streptomyces sp. NPDC005438 TaxID=3156880 RepID=UPI0033B0B5F1